MQCPETGDGIRLPCQQGICSETFSQNNAMRGGGNEL